MIEGISFTENAHKTMLMKEMGPIIITADYQIRSDQIMTQLCYNITDIYNCLLNIT